MLSARWRDAVILCFAVVFGCAPKGRDQPLIFEPMERWVKRAMFYLQNLVRGLFDDMGDGVSMGGSRQNGFKNEDVEGSLKEIASFIIPGFTRHRLYFDFISQDNLLECHIL